MSRVRDRLSPNCDDRGDAAIDMLVIHYTGMTSAEAALARLCDPAAKVSAHYLVDEDGTVTRLVPEDRRAWHAGVACWRGVRDVNARSLGIELVNPGHEFGYRPFAEPQMRALGALAGDLVARHGIPARNVVGHSDVAPTRKADPGELFDWQRLAAAGIGLWPPVRTGEPVPEAGIADALATYGYDTEDLQAAIVAFQRHFAPHRTDGVADATTRVALAALLRAIGTG